MRVFITAWLLITAGVFGQTGQEDAAAAAAVQGAVQGPTQGAAQGYVLGSGDLLTVWVADAEDMSQRPLRVDHTGSIRLPLVGLVHVAGLTTTQVEAELVERLARYMKHPQVSVTVTEYRSQPVSVLGAVNQPGIQQLQGKRTLVELLAMAGGPSDQAGAVVRLTRQATWGPIPVPGAKPDTSGQFSVAEFNLKSLLAGETPEANVVIRPNDVISVPRGQMVYVVGEVGHAGGFVLKDQETMTALQALALAGGMLRTASPGKAKILRMQPGGADRTETAVDLKKVLEGKATDVSLRPDDILFVPSSAPKRAAARAAEAILQTATGVVIWRGGNF